MRALPFSHLLLLLLSAAALSTAVTASAPPSVTVSTPLGDVVGFVKRSENGETQQFWNVPFALPPLDELRWRPPQPLRRFPSSPFDATNSSARHCELTPDCLYLSITVPSASSARPKDGWPVYVFIYGGAFVGSAMLDASEVVAFSQSFLYVAVNYRLGLLGFFPHAELTAENQRLQAFNSSGNQGVQDQTAGLSWVRDYISAFGGDPRRVTVGGESAGSVSVCMQLLSPAARGLFHHAILESGGCSAPIAIGGSLEQRQRDVGDVIVAKSSCADKPPGQRIACLRSLSFAEISRLQQLLPSIPGVWGLNYSPIWDGITLPDSPARLFASGQFNRVPLLLGTNSGETAMVLYPNGPDYNYSYTRQSIRDHIGYYASNNADELFAFYSNSSDFPLADNLVRAYIESTTAVIFVCPMRTLARAMAAAGQPVYLYRDQYIDVNGWSWLNVTVHAQELQHFYRSGDWQAADEAVVISAQMQNQLLRFLQTGSPNTPIAADSRYAGLYANDPLPVWPEYSVSNNLTLVYSNYPSSISTAAASHFSIVAGTDDGQCDLWDQAIPPNWWREEGEASVRA